MTPGCCALLAGWLRRSQRQNNDCVRDQVKYVKCDKEGEFTVMSNIITGAIAVSMALVYLLYYAFRLNDIALWIIIGVNLAFLLYDFYNSVTKGEDHI